VSFGNGSEHFGRTYCLNLCCDKLEVLTAVNTRLQVMRFVTPCNLLDRYQLVSRSRRLNAVPEAGIAGPAEALEPFQWITKGH